MSNLLDVAYSGLTRKEMADVYAAAINDPNTDWPTLNAAIMKRWSKSGLIYIKTLAWKKHDAEKSKN